MDDFAAHYPDQPLTEAERAWAREALGGRGMSDVPDGHVACVASAREAVVATSDPDDIAALADPSAPLALIAV